MAVAIYTPRTLINKHFDALAVVLVLFLIGFMLGLQPEYGQSIIEKAREREVEPANVRLNFQAILVNNVLIAFFSWSGWFLFPVMGTEFIPPAITVYNVGSAFGAVVAHNPLQSLISLLTFGIIEATGFIFATTGGMLFPKYILLKLFRKPVEIAETLSDAAVFLAYAAFLLLISAFIEAFLIYPVTSAFAVLFGVIITVLIFRSLKGT